MDSFHTDVQVLDDQLEFIYNSSVRKQDVHSKTGRKQVMIETNGGRESEKSVLAARHDDGDDDDDDDDDGGIHYKAKNKNYFISILKTTISFCLYQIKPISTKMV